MSGNWGAALSAFAPYILYFMGFILFLVVVWLVGIRVMTQGRLLATFHKNRRKTGGLFKIDADHNCIWVKTKENPRGEKYNITPDFIEWVDYPGGWIPSMFCVSVRSLEYVRYEKDPYHPEKHIGKVSARSNKFITDENVLGAVYHYAERSLGVQRARQNMILMIALVAIFGISLFSAYMSMQANNTARALLNALGGG